MNFGKQINIDNIDAYKKKNNYNSKSKKRYITFALKKMKLLDFSNHFKYSNLIKISKEQDLIIIIGADNFDITYNMQEELNRFNKMIRKNTKAKMILYDCSIDERDITEILTESFKQFDYITVRESVTQENIKNIIEKDKIYYYPDPAFIMPLQEVELPKVFKNAKVIGVNVSNLITNKVYGAQAGDILKAYIKMLDYILEKTEYNIILIPHVMKNADLSALKLLYQNYIDNNRVELILNENLNSKELKYIISQCEMFIGARTHATIAAYSTCVPTLVLGYSVKSKGIAIDLFGTDKNYVLPVKDLESEDYLLEGFKWLFLNKKIIKDTLEEKIPIYMDNAKKFAEII